MVRIDTHTSAISQTGVALLAQQLTIALFVSNVIAYPVNSDFLWISLFKAVLYACYNLTTHVVI